MYGIYYGDYQMTLFSEENLKKTFTQEEVTKQELSEQDKIINLPDDQEIKVIYQTVSTSPTSL